MTTRDNVHDHERAAKIEAMQAHVDEALTSGLPGPFDFETFLARKRHEHGSKV